MTEVDVERDEIAESTTRWAGWWADHDRTAFAIVCSLAVLPTVVWGVIGASYLSDDYWMALWLDEYGVRAGMEKIAFDRPGRPLAALYYLFTYQVLGEWAVGQVLVLVAVNLAMVDGLRRLGRHFLLPHHLYPTLILFAVLANHSTTRFWFVVGTYPLAVAMVAYAGSLVLRRQVVLGSLLMAGALLLYEGVAGFCIVVVALLLWKDRRHTSAWLMPGIATVLASVFMYLNSPKAAAQQNGTYPKPFEFGETLVPAQFGTGLIDVDALGRVSVALIVVVVVSAIVMRWFPSFGSPSSFDALVLAGAVVCVVCAGPMLVGGSLFATSGINDRNNLLPSIGASLVLAGPLVTLGRRRPRSSVALLAVAAIASTALSFSDLKTYRQSVLDGRRVEIGIVAALPDPSEYHGMSVLLSPQPPSIDGVAAFIESYDIQGAMRLHHGGEWSFLVVHAAEACRLGLPLHVLNWKQASIEPATSASICRS